MPIYQRVNRETKKPLRGQYRIVLWAQGSRREKQFSGTKKEAESFLARWQIEAESERATDVRVAPSFSSFCERRYRVHAKISLKKSTYKRREYTLAILMDYFGDMLLTQIRAQEIEEYRHTRLEAGINTTTINDDIRALKRILSYARSVGVPASDPRIKKLPERKTKGRVMVWSVADVGKLYAAFEAKSKHLLPITVAMLNTGMRKGEALALEWSSVDLAHDMIKIWPSEDWQPKSGEPREIPIGSALKPWLTGPRLSERWVFPAPKTGERYAVWPQKQWDRARVAAGVGGSPHVCRHTYASHFLSARGDMFLLAQVLGHSQTRVTEMYSHLLPDHLERARDAVCLPVLPAEGEGNG